MTFRVTYSVLDADLDELHRTFDQALAAVRQELGKSYELQPASKAWLDDYNPANRAELLARFPLLPLAALDEVMVRAKAAQKRWAKQPWQERLAKCRRIADLISEKRMRLAAIMTLETGKSRLEALGDVEEAADLFRYYAGQLEEAQGFSRPLARLSPKEDTRDVLRPYGTFVVISPFNFPMALGAGMSAGALLGGNSVVLKPSEETPWIAYELGKIAEEAGLERDLFQVVFGTGAELGAALVQHKGTAGVAFTGSKAVGLSIVRQLSTTFIKPALLELGGKNPCIVCADADLAMAAVGSALFAFGLSGQKCSALSRLLVHESVKDRFVELLIAETKKLKIGQPSERDVFVGPVINRRAVERFHQAVATAKRDGEILYGGEDLSQQFPGHFVAPTIVRVPRGHALSRDELFLPLVTIDTWKTFDEAMAVANDCDYGLTAGIYSRDSATIENFMEQIEAGVVYANRPTGATTGAWPGVQSFCGWKGSGSTGKGGCGPYYVSQFMREQSQTRMG